MERWRAISERWGTGLPSYDKEGRVRVRPRMLDAMGRNYERARRP